MRTKALFALLAFSIFLTSLASAAEQVAIRAANGRFLHCTADGAIRAGSLFPGENETFELVPRGEQEIALKGPGGRYLVSDIRDARIPRLGEPATEARSTHQLVPSGSNGFSIRPAGTDTLFLFDPKAPAARETVEIYDVHTMPALQTALATIVQSVAGEELLGKQYDKTGKHDTNKYLDLPDPTLRDPRQTKRVQVLGMTEEYRVQAQLDGKPEIRIPAMLYLSNHRQGGPGIILVAVDAGLPVRGRVQGSLAELASVSTGYSAVIQLSLVAQLEVRHSGSDVKIGPCTVLDMHAAFSRLEFSKDLLEAAHRPIKRIVNLELARNEERLRKGANDSLQKAISSHDIRLPLLGYLGLMP